MARTFQILQPIILAMKSWSRNTLRKNLHRFRNFTVIRSGPRGGLPRSSGSKRGRQSVLDLDNNHTELWPPHRVVNQTSPQAPRHRPTTPLQCLAIPTATAAHNRGWIQFTERRNWKPYEKIL